jgi:hypothetical protein
MNAVHLPLGIIELLTRVGEPYLRVQSLITSLTNAKTRPRGDTLLTFGTDQITARDLAHKYYPMTGLIVWVPTHRLQDALRTPELVIDVEETPTC